MFIQTVVDELDLMVRFSPEMVVIGTSLISYDVERAHFVPRSLLSRHPR